MAKQRGTNKGGRKNGTKAVELRRVGVAEFYLKGYSQQRIADMYGVSRSQIAHDIKIIRQEWAESRISDYGEFVDQELAKIDLLEQTLWDAYEKSCAVYRLTTVKVKQKREEISPKDGKSGSEAPTIATVGEQEVEKTTAERGGGAGDPRFLVQIAALIDKRVALRGMIIPKKLPGEDEDQGVSHVIMLPDNGRD